MKELNLYKIQNKLRNKFLKSGVKMMGPETIFFSTDTKIGKNVTIEEKSIVGAGSVITKSVKKKSLALTRSLQTEIKNYKRK